MALATCVTAGATEAVAGEDEDATEVRTIWFVASPWQSVETDPAMRGWSEGTAAVTCIPALAWSEVSGATSSKMKVLPAGISMDFIMPAVVAAAVVPAVVGDAEVAAAVVPAVVGEAVVAAAAVPAVVGDAVVAAAAVPAVVGDAVVAAAVAPAVVGDAATASSPEGRVPR